MNNHLSVALLDHHNGNASHTKLCRTPVKIRLKVLEGTFSVSIGEDGSCPRLDKSVSFSIRYELKYFFSIPDLCPHCKIVHLLI